MKCNVGKTDKTVRVFLGLTILGVGLSMQSWWAVIGLIPIATVLLGWCPFYVPFGISTCETVAYSEKVPVRHSKRL